MAKIKEVKKNFEETLAELNKQFGKGTIVHSNEKLVETYDVIPTGSINIDYLALGIGGFAKSKIYELRGWQGSNKTTICGHLVASVQKNGGKAVCIDSEHAWDLTYLSQLGVNIDDLYICQPDYGEQGFEVAIALLGTGEVDIIIIDSDSALQPKTVMEGEIGQSAIGKKAKLNSDFYPKLKVAVGKSNTCVVVVSQYRDKVGVMFGDPRTTQGGHALEFYSDVIIDLTKSLRKEGDETSGTNTTFKTLKNKTYVPFRSYKFPTLFGYGIDRIQETLDLADEYEIIKKWGEKVTYNEEKYNLADFTTMLSDNEEFLEEIRSKIIQKIKS